MFRFRFKRVLSGAVFALFAAMPNGGHAAERPVQFVVISFDGAREIEQWNRSRELARKAGANFTFFLSCTNLIAAENKFDYAPPGHKRGASNIGFAESREDIAARLRQIWTARLEGHEIANHGCGHFDGGGWSKGQWIAEFGAFTSFLRDAWSINGIPFAPAGWTKFVETEITGFRAPYLSVGSALEPALAEAGFTYDASTVSRDPQQPSGGKVVGFSLPMIPEGPNARRILAMDYNLYVRHSAAMEQPSKSAEFEERAYLAFRGAFERQYRGDRVPLQLGFHFRLMNDGAYWRALERFAMETCSLPEVRCVSYRDLLRQQNSATLSEAGAKPVTD
ncbi:polysaccharide deacetylase [Mesorhizobium sp. Z1-4]|uniref:polysaccharide deacetylase n=1 Tax=Mesorhizobium sp. Z1-4 TaxID=2448478 RepID=UPI001FDFA329|nr:polysaccharide deacetylase [Mesorhizobium sp. Z1-4]